MSEKRFTIEESENQLIIFDNGVSDETYFHLGNDERDVKYVCDLLNEQQSTIVHLRKQIQIYEQLISNSYVGEEETLDGFVGKYVIWENELQKYKEKIKGVFNE